MDFLEMDDEARSKLDALREKAENLKVSIDSVRNANVSYADLSQRLAASLSYEMQYSDAQNDFNAFILADYGGKVLPRSIDIGRLCYLFGPDQIRNLIMERIKASPLKPGMPLADRPKKIAELQRELRQAEIDIERETLRLEGAGHKILRHVGAPPDVLLALWAELPAA